jgi:predicted nucleotide-binding protein
MRVFISYSHDSHEHKKWILNLANDLNEKGFEVILDQTHLKPGTDILHFAESAVESSNYVLMICTPNYAYKANNRTAGVGWEVSMITSELFNGKGIDGKFIAILKEDDPGISIPKFMKTKLYVDVRGDKFKNAWDELVTHMIKNGASNQIGTLLFEAMFKYDKNRIYDQPRLEELRRFTDFVETGKNINDRWFVLRKDPIKGDLATILFQD